MKKLEPNLMSIIKFQTSGNKILGKISKFTTRIIIFRSILIPSKVYKGLIGKYKYNVKDRCQ